MQQKQLFVLAGTLIVLLGIAWVSGVFDRNPSNIRVPSLDIPADEVTSFTLTLPEDTMEFERQTMGWYMQKPAESIADSMTISRFLNDLGGLTLDTRATSNPDRHHLYGIDSTATTVTLHWGNESKQLTLSQQGRDYTSIYVRIEDDPEVYSTNSRVTVTRDVSRWRDRLILRMDAFAIASAQITRPEDSYTITQTNGAWMVDEAPADSLEITSWLRRFNPLNADGFFDGIPPRFSLMLRTELILSPRREPHHCMFSHTNPPLP